VVEEVLAATGGVSEVSLEPVLERLSARGIFADGVDLKGLMRGGRLRTLPGVGFQGDGFFAALLTR
jgi:16S rRNA C967 or C1407 C5-methylase (RsmB/RsmF family)